MHYDPVVERGVGGHHHRLGPDFAAGGRHGLALVVAADAVRVGAAVDPAALRGEGARQAIEVFERMELGLVGVAHAGAGVEGQTRHAGQELGLDAGACSAGLFLAEVVRALHAVRRQGVQVAVEALEFAADAFVAHDGFDHADGARMAVGHQARLGGAELVLDEGIPFVGREQVGGGAPGLAGADAEGVDQHHLAPLAREQVGGGQPGDAGADDAYLGVDVPLQGRKDGHRSGVHPDRSGTAVGRTDHAGLRILMVEPSLLRWRMGWSTMRGARAAARTFPGNARTTGRFVA